MTIYGEFKKNGSRNSQSSLFEVQGNPSCASVRLPWGIRGSPDALGEAALGTSIHALVKLLLQDSYPKEARMENETTGPDDILNAAEVAALLRIHPVTVRLQAAAGVIPGRQIGNRWRFSRKRIVEWMQKNDTSSDHDR